MSAKESEKLMAAASYREIASCQCGDDHGGSGVPPVEQRAESASLRDVDPVHALTLNDIYCRHYERILRLALRITRNVQDAEDVAHECFIRVFVHLGSFSGKSKLSTWISRIAINAALMNIRKRRSNECSIDHPMEGPATTRLLEIKCHAPAPEERFLQRERAKMLCDSLARLSPDLVRTVGLYYFGELSVQECAQILGISLSGVKSRILRAKHRLRRGFDESLDSGATPSRSQGIPERLFRSPIGRPASRHHAVEVQAEKRRHQ